MTTHRFPDIVLAGTPKSGTSSLFKWLIDNPAIEPISNEETYYLLDKENPYLNPSSNYHSHHLKQYQINKNKTRNQKNLLIEYCTHYMYQETAIDFLSSLETKPYIIFLLRNPINRTFSSFSYSKSKKLSIKKELSFQVFIDLLINNRLNEIHEACLSEKSYFSRITEIEYSKYSFYLSKWLNKFPKEKIKILVFEDFIKNPQKELIEISKDLNINSDFYKTYPFKTINITQDVKNELTHKFFSKAYEYIPKNRLTSKFTDLYWIFQGKKASKNKIDDTTLSNLKTVFKEYNKSLTEEFSLDISCWN
jgi:hypothetical protein